MSQNQYSYLNILVLSNPVFKLKHHYIYICTLWIDPKIEVPSWTIGCSKAELLQLGIFFLIHLFAWEVLLIKKLEIKETKDRSTFFGDFLVRAEILVILGLHFGRNNDLINSFWVVPGLTDL